MSSAYSSFVDRQRHPSRPHYRMQFTQRDLRILEHLHFYGGVLSDDHLQALEFPATKGKACRGRLSKLFHQGYLARSTRVGTVYSGATVYWLTPQGAREVASSLGDRESRGQFVG
jgi:hypothetical protein